MPSLLIATHNRDKLTEFRHLLEPLGYRLEGAADLVGYPEPEETGQTLEENALLKARALFEYSGRTAVADDTGLAVEALGGAPGVYSARFAGEGASYQDNVRLLLERLEGVPGERRGARFETVIAVVGPGLALTLKGVCEGRITTRARGSRGFGYDPVFQPEGLSQTFAELDLDAKNLISHRGRALRALRDWLATGPAIL
jgi:XTP/dITP diphosphohydrolase